MFKDLATLVDDDQSDLVRMLATQSIQIKPPSLEMSKQNRKKLPRALLPRSISVANLSDTSKNTGSGGIKLWWEKFSGRFKRLNRVEMIQGSVVTIGYLYWVILHELIIFGSKYSTHIPKLNIFYIPYSTFGQILFVTTLVQGRERLMSVNELQYSELLPSSPIFTLGFTESRPVGSQRGQLDITPQFPQTNKHAKSLNAEPAMLPGSNLLKTRKLLLHSISLTQSPSASLGLDKVSD